MCKVCFLKKRCSDPGMQIIAGSQENYPAVNVIFPAVKHYFFLQNIFKCCQKIVIYLFHLFTPSNLGLVCQRHARVGLWPKYPSIIARFLPVKNFSYIPGDPRTLVGNLLYNSVPLHCSKSSRYYSGRDSLVTSPFKYQVEGVMWI